MSPLVLRGLAAAGGVAVGRALVVRDLEPPEADGAGGEAEQDRAVAALGLVADELSRLAQLARTAGRSEEAEILEANRLIAEDPVLVEEVRVLAKDASAAASIRRATARHADLLSGLDDPLLASRAADVRQLGRRAARLLSGAPAFVLPRSGAILVARDLGPADVAELELSGGRVQGIALAEGAATSHVAIMARSLGLPMAVGLGEELLETPDSEEIVLDGDGGVVVVRPAADTRRLALAVVDRQERERRRLAATRVLPAETRDGRELRLLCNASSLAEVSAGLAAGAEGVGLLRTELAFLEFDAWPEEADQRAYLEPLLAPLQGRVATLRTLDFGADKTPPFLAGVVERGLTLTLAHPAALTAQLRAFLRTAANTQLRILLPMVETADELRTARRLMLEAIDETAWSGPAPELGAMIETPAAAARAKEIAADADFLSIGTNDLVQYTLGLDRELPVASAQAAADPRVLRLVAAVVEAAQARRIAVEVCGEAAGEPPLVALLVGLGVDELSVSPSRLDEVRDVVRRLSAAATARTARAALKASSAEEALALARPLVSAQAGHELGEARDSLGGVLA
jgi:phosphoenolpyruvate-protein phosphotransferase